MNTTDDQTREQRLRRKAERQGMQLKKSRSRSRSVDDWGGYMILDPNQGTVLYGERFDLTIDDVEHILEGTTLSPK